jgi:threonine/homoserine/homoserine lactone efflux protein
MLIYDCTTIKGAEAYASNVAADIIAIIASVITCLWYGYSFLQRWKEARSAPIQETNKERAGRTLRQTGLPVLPLASLSALWASALGFIFLYAGEQTWPQILEGLALMTVVYAQVSALIWQEHDPEGWIKDMADRIPDVIAVIVAIVTLWFVRNAYIQDSQNSFYTSHDPLQEVILSIALTALGFTIGVFQEGFFCSAARRSGTACKYFLSRPTCSFHVC